MDETLRCSTAGALVLMSLGSTAIALLMLRDRLRGDSPERDRKPMPDNLRRLPDQRVREAVARIGSRLAG